MVVALNLALSWSVLYFRLSGCLQGYQPVDSAQIVRRTMAHRVTFVAALREALDCHMSERIAVVAMVMHEERDIVVIED